MTTITLREDLTPDDISNLTPNEQREHLRAYMVGLYEESRTIADALQPHLEGYRKNAVLLMCATALLALLPVGNPMQEYVRDRFWKEWGAPAKPNRPTHRRTHH
jgi:hypothetical protein